MILYSSFNIINESKLHCYSLLSYYESRIYNATFIIACKATACKPAMSGSDYEMLFAEMSISSVFISFLFTTVLAVLCLEWKKMLGTG